MSDHICSVINTGDETVNVEEVVTRVGEAAGDRLQHGLLSETVAVLR